jgi:RimJ/RimL family protein N-acetyltransferase
MEWKTPLFEGQLIYLASIKPEKDAELESRWTHDAEYQRMLGTDLVCPLSPAQIRKKYTEIEKEMEEKGNQFYFTIRRLPYKINSESTNEGEDGAGDLLGFIKLDWIEWSLGAGSVSLGIGEPAERGQGFGSDALRLLLRYAFGELNLYRLGAVIPEYNQVALRLFEKAGFKVEARQREALHRAGSRWDIIRLGLLREEWEIR